jgi:hypothetical protein
LVILNFVKDYQAFPAKAMQGQGFSSNPQRSWG